MPGYKIINVLLAFIVLSLFPCELKAQRNFTKRDGLGVHAGVNFSDIISRSANFNNVPKLGPKVGVNLESTIIKQFYSRTELNYSLIGARVSEFTVQGINYDQNHHIIELPFLGCFEFKKGFGIGGGVYARYLLNVTESTQNAIQSGNAFLNKGSYRNFGMGYVVETNFYSESGINGGLRYQRSIFIINDFLDQYHQVISLYIGYLFNNAR